MEMLELTAEQDENFVLSAAEARKRVQKQVDETVANEIEEIYKDIFRLSGLGDEAYCHVFKPRKYVGCVLAKVEQILSSQGYIVTANNLEMSLHIDWSVAD